MGSESFEPINANSNGFNLNHSEWIIIVILIAIIVILTIVLCVVCYKRQSKIDTLRSSLNKEFTDEELKLINNYRSLDRQRKTIINNTCKTLINEETTLNNKNDGV